MDPRPPNRVARRREAGFSVGGNEHARLPDYNSLYDRNLRTHFESKHVRKVLNDACLINKEGRILNTERNKGRLFIIDQEFEAAEREELWRQRAEDFDRRRLEARKVQNLSHMTRVAQAQATHSTVRQATSAPSSTKSVTKPKPKPQESPKSTSEAADTKRDAAPMTSDSEQEEKPKVQRRTSSTISASQRARSTTPDSPTTNTRGKSPTSSHSSKSEKAESEEDKKSASSRASSRSSSRSSAKSAASSGSSSASGSGSGSGSDSD